MQPHDLWWTTNAVQGEESPLHFFKIPGPSAVCLLNIHCHILIATSTFCYIPASNSRYLLYNGHIISDLGKITQLEEPSAHSQYLVTDCERFMYMKCAQFYCHAPLF